MKVRLIAVGERMPDWVDAGYAEYAKRLSGEQVQSAAPMIAAADPEPEPAAEVDLLEGPQLPGKGLDQDAIDQLLRG